MFQVSSRRLRKRPVWQKSTAVLRCIQCPRVVLIVSPALDLCHERSARVSLTGVLAAVVVPGADHLVVDDHVDALPFVPPLALAVVDHRHVHNLKKKNKCVAHSERHQFESPAIQPTTPRHQGAFAAKLAVRKFLTGNHFSFGIIGIIAVCGLAPRS